MKNNKDEISDSKQSEAKTSINQQDKIYTAKQNKVNFIAILMFLGFVVAVFYYYVQGVYLSRGYPYNTCLFAPIDRFNDFIHTYNLTVRLNPYFETYIFNSNYYPFLHILFYPFTFFPVGYGFFLFLLLFAELLFYFNYIFLRTDNLFETIKNVLIISICSYPVLFIIDRGSFEGFVFALLAGFFIAIDKKKETLACVFLASAIATKLYPAVFIVFLITEKKYKAAIKTSFFVIFFTLLSLLFFEGGFVKNLDYMIGFGHATGTYIANSMAIQRCVSLFTVLKISIIKLGLINYVDFNNVLRIYTISVFSIFAVLCCLMWYFSFKAWEKIFLLISAMILFPHISADYKLIFMYLPLWFLINEDSYSRSDYLYLAAIGVLLIPKNYFLLEGILSDSNRSDLSTGIFVNVFLMVAVSLSIVVDAIKRGITSGGKTADNIKLPFT
jgi:hypothetical protein